jgi:hypothetical protein
MTAATTEITTMGTVKAFTQDACSGTLMGVLDRAYGHPMEAEEAASNPLAGGIVQQGYQCGQLWGASLAAGAQAYRTFGAGPRAEAAAVKASQRVVEAFRGMNRETNCLELTDTPMQDVKGVLRYFAKAGPVRCGRMAVRFAPVAYQEIEQALAEVPTEATPPCANCAAMVARKMGASEQHTVMAAGLAGGIGLGGGGCGALAAAIWLTGINRPEEKTGLSAEGTTIGEVIDAFVKSSDHEFECAEIAGRTFEDAADHARYMASGGCARILDALVEAAGVQDAHACDELAA